MRHRPEHGILPPCERLVPDWHQGRHQRAANRQPEQPETELAKMLIATSYRYRHAGWSWGRVIASVSRSWRSSQKDSPSQGVAGAAGEASLCPVALVSTRRFINV